MIVDRVLGEGARLQLGRHAARGGVAGLVARGHRQRRRRRRSRRAARSARCARPCRPGRRGSSGRPAAPTLDVHAGGVGRAEGDEHGAARRDVARGGQDLEPRRREVDRDGHCEASARSPGRSGRQKSSRAQTSSVAAPSLRPRAAVSTVTGSSTRGAGEAAGARDRDGLAALHDPHLGAARRCRARPRASTVNGGVVAEERSGPGRWRADTGHGLPPAEVGHGRRPPRGAGPVRRGPTPSSGTAEARRRIIACVTRRRRKRCRLTPLRARR